MEMKRTEELKQLVRVFPDDFGGKSVFMSNHS